MRNTDQNLTCQPFTASLLTCLFNCLTTHPLHSLIHQWWVGGSWPVVVGGWAAFITQQSPCQPPHLLFLPCTQLLCQLLIFAAVNRSGQQQWAVGGLFTHRHPLTIHPPPLPATHCFRVPFHSLHPRWLSKCLYTCTCYGIMVLCGRSTQDLYRWEPNHVQIHDLGTFRTHIPDLCRL